MVMVLEMKLYWFEKDDGFTYTDSLGLRVHLHAMLVPKISLHTRKTDP